MKEKITTGTNDRPNRGPDAPTGENPPDDGGPIIEVGSDGEATVREDLEKGPARPKPPRGPAVDDEDPDYSPMDEGRKTGPGRAEDDRKSGNIETDAPGRQQSLNDINAGVEELIEQREDERKND